MQSVSVNSEENQHGLDSTLSNQMGKSHELPKPVSPSVKW